MSNPTLARRRSATAQRVSNGASQAKTRAGLGRAAKPLRPSSAPVREAVLAKIGAQRLVCSGRAAVCPA